MIKLALSGPTRDIINADIGDPLKDELSREEELRRRELHVIVKEIRKKYSEVSK